MIELKDISHTFAGKLVLKNITLTLRPGQTHVLLGRSGAGKSTLLRILIGVLRPGQGEILVSGHRLERSDPADIGYVPQQGGLFPHLTGYENVVLVAKTRGWPAEKIAARWNEIAPLVSLKPEIFDRYPHEISGGESQRIAILRAVFLNPARLVLDEPLSALDPLVRSKLQTDLKALFNRLKKTVIIVTHDLAEAAYFGHTINLLHDGSLIQSGPFEELRDHPAHPFVTEFIQSQRDLQLKESP